MTEKNKKSLLTVMLGKVSNLAWLKKAHSLPHKNMQPGKGFNQPISDHAFDYLKELNDEEFEKLIVMIFKQRGYSVLENEIDVDVVLKMGNIKTVVQYTHWREYQVNNEAIEPLLNVMDAEDISHGIVITSGTFTDEVLENISGKHLMLINGVDLSQMIEVLISSDTKELEELSEIPVEEQMPELEPLCPICSQQMLKRTAKKGKNAGNTFWGCSQFPNCRGVISN